MEVWGLVKNFTKMFHLIFRCNRLRSMIGTALGLTVANVVRLTFKKVKTGHTRITVLLLGADRLLDKMLVISKDDLVGGLQVCPNILETSRGLTLEAQVPMGRRILVSNQMLGVGKDHS